MREAPALPKNRALTRQNQPHCSLRRFLLWLAPWFVLLAWGLAASAIILGRGLEVTRLNDLMAYGLWITFDLSIMALAGGAFVTVLLLYCLKKTVLASVAPLAVLLGFVCYTGAVGVLLLEIGQPLRSWFGFWHANVASMLTEVIFCVTLYCLVLGIEFLPTIFKGNWTRQRPFWRDLGHNLQWTMPLFALIGIFLSIFHQGSLGGMYGVLFARPFTFREGFLGIWPWTFFLFVLSSAGAGPLFTLLAASLTEKLTGRSLIPERVKRTLAKCGGLILAVYTLCKALDTIIWSKEILPRFGLVFGDMFQGALYGQGLLGMEIIACGLLPCVILLIPVLRRRRRLLHCAALLACLGVFINRYVQTVQNLAVPTLPFESWTSYLPNWVEIAPCAAALAYGVIAVSLAYRWLPLFPAEVEKASTP